MLLISMKVPVSSHQVLICINRKVGLSAWLWINCVVLDENCNRSPERISSVAAFSAKAGTLRSSLRSRLMAKPDRSSRRSPYWGHGSRMCFSVCVPLLRPHYGVAMEEVNIRVATKALTIVSSTPCYFENHAACMLNPIKST